jgi:hypothetical protein
MVEWTKGMMAEHEFGKKMDDYNYTLATDTTLNDCLDQYRNMLQNEDYGGMQQKIMDNKPECGKKKENYNFVFATATYLNEW